jgi:hypothetical protein
MVNSIDKTAADAARLFSVHRATISQLLARAHANVGLKHAQHLTKFYATEER